MWDKGSVHSACLAVAYAHLNLRPAVPCHAIRPSPLPSPSLPTRRGRKAAAAAGPGLCPWRPRTEHAGFCADAGRAGTGTDNAGSMLQTCQEAFKLACNPRPCYAPSRRLRHCVHLLPLHAGRALAGGHHGRQRRARGPQPHVGLAAAEARRSLCQAGRCVSEGWWHLPCRAACMATSRTAPATLSLWPHPGPLASLAPPAGDDEAARRLAQAAEGVASLFGDAARQGEVDKLFADFSAAHVSCGVLTAVALQLLCMAQEEMGCSTCSCGSTAWSAASWEWQWGWHAVERLPFPPRPAGEAERPWLRGASQGERCGQREVAGPARQGGVRLDRGPAAGAERRLAHAATLSAQCSHVRFTMFIMFSRQTGRGGCA